MLRQGDPRPDRTDPEPGTVTIENTQQNTESGAAGQPGQARRIPEIDREELLAQDENARHFFDEIQKLKRNLSRLKQQELLRVDPLQTGSAGPAEGQARDAAKAGSAAPSPARKEGSAPATAGASETPTKDAGKTSPAEGPARTSRQDRMDQIGEAAADAAEAAIAAVDDEPAAAEVTEIAGEAGLIDGSAPEVVAMNAARIFDAAHKAAARTPVSEEAQAAVATSVAAVTSDARAKGGATAPQGDSSSQTGGTGPQAGGSGPAADRQGAAAGGYGPATASAEAGGPGSKSPAAQAGSQSGSQIASQAGSQPGSQPTAQSGTQPTPQSGTEPGTQPTPVDPAAAGQQEAAANIFEAQFRKQMEDQLQQVQKEENDRAHQRAIKAARREAYRREKAARNEARREERRARAKRKQQERELRAEVKRKKRIAEKSARMGGGIVTTHDTTVSTEIQPVAAFNWRDLLGIVPRSERRAAETEEELRAIREEQEKKTAEARATASQLRQVRASRYHNSAFGRRMDAFKKACESHKTPLLWVMSLVLLVCVGAAGIVNYCTVYEYSYNEHVLGYVKSKDQVLHITDMVQRALTEDKDMQVIIDAKEDISFKRVSLLDRDVVPDTSEEVLRRLTYMGDLNVKAYGIYVNGDKIGSVKSKDMAAEVLKNIEDRYASDKKGTVIEKAEILETVDVRKSNSSLRDVYSADRMAELLCTSGRKETVHTVIAGETLNDIAQMYQTTEDQLQADNEGVDPTRLEVGSTLLIRQNAPLLTVRMTEKRDYTQKIKYKTEEKKTDEMYEDETLVEQEGENGSEDIVERTVSINGEVESIKVLKHEVTKEPVTKIVLVGTAERPPTVGDGKYIWPLAGGYTLTSHYGYRWGRLHAGIDLGTSTGNDVLAADGGTVIRAGYFGGYGYCVDIDHQNGQMTRYGHLSSILVSVGDEVYEGQHIAESGNTGASTGPHLHFEIHSNGSSHDPLQDLP